MASKASSSASASASKSQASSGQKVGYLIYFLSFDSDLLCSDSSLVRFWPYFLHGLSGI